MRPINNITYTGSVISPFPKAQVGVRFGRHCPGPAPDLKRELESQPITCNIFERLIFFSKLLLTEGLLMNMAFR